MSKREKTKEYQLATELLKTDNVKDLNGVKGILDTLYSNMVQILLEEEMNEHLGYEKNSQQEKNDKNRRNGYSSKNKKVSTDNGVIQINMPRDREGSFDPSLIKKRQKVLAGVDDIIISLYAKGNTLQDIKELLIKLYKII